MKYPKLKFYNEYTKEEQGLAEIVEYINDNELPNDKEIITIITYSGKDPAWAKRSVRDIKLAYLAALKEMLNF